MAHVQQVWKRCEDGQKEEEEDKTDTSSHTDAQHTKKLSIGVESILVFTLTYFT